MAHKIKKIVEELYEIEPSLKEKEDVILKVVEKMIVVKPEVKIPIEFKEELKSKIHHKIAVKKLKTYKENPKVKLSQVILYLFSGAVMMSVIFVSFNNLGFFDKQFTKDKKDISFVVNPILIPEKDDIKKEEIPEKTEIIPEIPEKNIVKDIEEKAKPKVKQKTILPQEKKIVKNENISLANEIKSDVNKVDIPKKNDEFVYPTQVYDLIFTPKITGSTSDNQMLSDVVPSSSQSSLKMMPSSGLMRDSQILQNDNIELNDFSKIVKNLKIYGISSEELTGTNSGIKLFNEDKRYGMSFSIDYDKSMILIGKNISKWPIISYPDDFSITISDEEIKSISREFMANYNIDISSYGNSIIVTIPTKILENGKVYTSSDLVLDYSKGLKVKIDLFEKKVIQVSGL